MSSKARRMRRAAVVRVRELVASRRWLRSEWSWLRLRHASRRLVEVMRRTPNWADRPSQLFWVLRLLTMAECTVPDAVQALRKVSRAARPEWGVDTRFASASLVGYAIEGASVAQVRLFGDRLWKIHMQTREEFKVRDHATEEGRALMDKEVARWNELGIAPNVVGRGEYDRACDEHHLLLLEIGRTHRRPVAPIGVATTEATADAAE